MKAEVSGVCLPGEEGQGGYSPLKYHRGNLTDAGFIREVVEADDPQYVFHLAGNSDRSRDVSTFKRLIEDNLKTSCNLLEALVGRISVKSVLIVGTAEEYGPVPGPFREAFNERPVSAYSFSKLCIDKLATTFFDLYQLPVRIVRPSIVYGPCQNGTMFIPTLLQKLNIGEEFRMTEGRQKRDFIYIDDFLSALIEVSLRDTCNGQILNVSYGSSVYLRKVALMAESLMGVNGLLRIGSEPYRMGEIMDYRVSNAKLRKFTGWKPKINLRDGLRRTIDALRGESS